MEVWIFLEEMGVTRLTDEGSDDVSLMDCKFSEHHIFMSGLYIYYFNHTFNFLMSCGYLFIFITYLFILVVVSGNSFYCILCIVLLFCLLYVMYTYELLSEINICVCINNNLYMK